MKYFGIILGGGIGSRMKCNIPKQYITIKDKEIISFSIDAFRKSRLGENFIVVADSEEHCRYLEEKYNVRTILGGSTRNESFYNALQHIEKMGGCETVFVNEAARPMISSKLIDEFLDNIDGSISCTYCVKPITDSLETSESKYANRADYQLVMSPESYSFKVIKKYFNPNSKTTFPGHDIPDQYRKIQYRDYLNNIKITYPLDLIIFEALLKEKTK